MLRSHAQVLLALLVVDAGCRRDRSERSSAPEEASSEAGHERAIGATMAGYVDALAARDPVLAASWVSSTTFTFYERLRGLALAGTREQVEACSMMEVVMIIELRARYTRGELEQTDGRKLFDQAIRDGMQAQAMALEEVWVDDERGVAEIRDRGQAVVWLTREQGRWVIDLPAMIVGLGPLVEAELADAIASDGKLRVAYLLVEDGREGPGLDLAILDGPLD